VEQNNMESIPKNAQRAFDTYGDMVYRLALTRTRNLTDAEDIVQDVFLRYLRSAPAVLSPEHEKAWLLRVTINCTKSLATSAWRQQTTALPDDIAMADDLATPDAIVESHSVIGAVSQLPENYRTVIHLYYYEGYKTAEIAEMLSANDATVRSWLSRAREVLRVAIDIQDEE